MRYCEIHAIRRIRGTKASTSPVSHPARPVTDSVRDMRAKRAFTLLDHNTSLRLGKMLLAVCRMGLHRRGV